MLHRSVDHKNVHDCKLPYCSKCKHAAKGSQVGLLLTGTANILRLSFVTYLYTHGWAISWTWWRLLHYKILYHIISACTSKDSIFMCWHTPYISVTTTCCVVVLSQFIKNNSHQQKSHSSQLLIFCYKVKLWFKALACFWWWWCVVVVCGVWWWWWWWWWWWCVCVCVCVISYMILESFVNETIQYMV